MRRASLPSVSIIHKITRGQRLSVGTGARFLFLFYFYSNAPGHKSVSVYSMIQTLGLEETLRDIQVFLYIIPSVTSIDTFSDKIVTRGSMSLHFFRSRLFIVLGFLVVNAHLF